VRPVTPSETDFTGSGIVTGGDTADPALATSNVDVRPSGRNGCSYKTMWSASTALEAHGRTRCSGNPDLSQDYVQGQMSLHDGLITLADEQSQWVAWRSKLGRKLGASSFPSIPRPECFLVAFPPRPLSSRSFRSPWPNFVNFSHTTRSLDGSPRLRRFR